MKRVDVIQAAIGLTLACIGAGLLFGWPAALLAAGVLLVQDVYRGA
ncbi:MAG TPA: hypothetical protein VM487_15565 [Phycisphaerae bacterium]|nr:hypothetical protein [Phycisphaerae bacterium]